MMYKAKEHKTDVMRTRVEPMLKAHAEAIFQKLGLTTSQAITLFLKQVELRNGMPFPVNIPNAQTAKTLKDSEAGIDLIKADSIEDFFNKSGLNDKD